MFKNLKKRMRKKQGNEIIELKKIMRATLESDEQQHKDMMQNLYLVLQEHAEIVDRLDEMNQSRKAYNEAIGKLEQKSDDKDEKIKFLVQNNEELERRVKNFASISNKKFAFVEEIKKIKAEYQKRIDDLTNRLVEKEKTIMPKEEYKNLLKQKQQEMMKDKKKLEELEKLKSKKAEPSDYLTELSRITGSLEIIVEKIFFENPDLTEKQAIILLRKVKNPIGKRRWRVATIRNRVGTYLGKKSEILRVELYRSTPIGDAPLNKESGETLEKKDILSDAKGRPRKGMLLAVNKDVSIREPLWNDMQDSVMDGKWHAFSEVDKIIARHRHRQLSMKRICEIRRAYLQFSRDEEYHTARDGKEYLFELKNTGGVNRFRFTPAREEVKLEKTLEKTIPRGKYEKKWNEQLLGKKLNNDIVKWIEKNTCYKNVIFFNNVIVRISQELNKKKGKIYNPGQMHKFIADMLKTFPDKAVNPAQHRINAYRLYFERDGHITYKDWMYTINNDNLVPKQKKESETVEEKIVKDKHADVSFIDRLGM